MVNLLNFEFGTATRIVFGRGKVRELANGIQGFGRRALVVTGRDVGRARPILDMVQSAGVATTAWSITGEPTVDSIRIGVAHALTEKCDFVISLGGGSAIDAGKAIAALLTNPGDVYDYLEVIGSCNAIRHAPAPFVAIPTTAGTGSEVTRNSVLGSPPHRVKVSLRSPWMLAKLALIDPELTDDLPPELTASTGLDAHTQLIEPFVSVKANALTDAFCEGIVEGHSRTFPFALSSIFQSADGIEHPPIEREGHRLGCAATICVSAIFAARAAIGTSAARASASGAR
jgi:alcohol dehydrogenase class IV